MMKKELLISKKNGWKIFRITYDEANDETEFKFLKMINAEPKHEKQLKENVISYRKYKDDIKDQIKLQNKKEHQDLINERKNIVLNSTDIDFSKFGWVRKLSFKFGITGGHSKKWVKKYMPEFYEKNCYKIKSHFK